MTACISEGLNVTMTLVITRCPMPTPWTHHAGLICHLCLKGLVPLQTLIDSHRTEGTSLVSQPHVVAVIYRGLLKHRNAMVPVFP